MLKLIGHRFNKESHDIRDFLARNYIDYEWVEAEDYAKMLGGDRCDKLRVPILRYWPDDEGSKFLLDERSWDLIQPTVAEVASKLDLCLAPEHAHYDLVVVGAGPAGLAAAVSGASEGLTTLVLDKYVAGGQAGSSSRIENYLGFPQGVSGAELSGKAAEQAVRLGAEIATIAQVTGMQRKGPAWEIQQGRAEISARAVVLATGVDWRRLDIPGADTLEGRGVYYGASLSEAKLCAGQEVVIIGGANSAGQAAMCFSRYAHRVTIVARSPLAKSMSQYLIDQIEGTANITVCEDAEVNYLHTRGGLLSAVDIHDAKGERYKTCSAVFAFIGAEPRTGWLPDEIKRDSHGFILSGPDAGVEHHLAASASGVFVAGDVRSRSIKRVASAVGEGSMCIPFVHQYLAQ